jgi:pimeloyl-ACP methyl ester carboxylesterase
MRKRAGGIFIAGAALGSVAVTASAALRRWRERLMPRREPHGPYDDFSVITSDGLCIAARLIPGGERGAVIVAHPAVTGQCYSPLVDLAEMLSDYFDVYTFDFRGHGCSGGRLEMDLSGPLEDMRSIVARVKKSPYAWVGAVGFSLGGMAAFMHAATYGGLDAVVTVGAPPLLPDIEPYRRVLPVWSLFLRFLGARFKAAGGGGPLPMHTADRFPHVPLLVVHGGNEVFYSRSDLDEMLEKLEGRAELWVIEGAGHTELGGRERDLVEWLVMRSESMPA